MPDHAPREYFNRSVLWNAVEKIEKNKNSQLSREIELALPIELSDNQNIELVREYCNQYFVSMGMCADISIHNKNDGNSHAHIMLTMRPFESDGSWAAKSKKEYILDEKGERIRQKSGDYKSRKVNTVDWNEQTRAEEWRQGWASMCNEFLKQAGVDERIDPRSYERQGIEQLPTIHMGVAAFQMEQKGIATERGDHNREINDINKELRQVRARIRKCKDWLYSQSPKNTPTLVDMMNGLAGGENLKTNWQRIKSLKTSSKVLIFLQNNNITRVEQLADKVTQMHEEFYNVSNELKAVERRLKTISEHLGHYENYKKYKAIYQKYKGIDSKKRNAFYDKHISEIQSYEAAKKHFDDCMNSRTALPIKEWQTEQNNLISKKYHLCEKYYQLKDEVQSIESLKCGAESIMNEEVFKERPMRIHGIEI